MASAPDPWRSNSHRRPSLSESVASVVSVRAVPKSGPSTSSDSSKNSIDDHDPPQYPDDPDAVFCPRYGNQDAWPDTAQTNESTGANANATGAGAAAGVAAQLETAEFERDQYRKKAEERNVTTHSLNPDNIRELYKLREDYAKLQAHAMELMDRAEASEKDAGKRAMVVRKFRDLEAEARMQVEELRSEMSKLRLEKNTMYQEIKIVRDDRDWWKAEHDKQETIAENGKASLIELRKMYMVMEREHMDKLEADHREATKRMQVEYEDKIAQINQEMSEKMKNEYEATVEVEKFVTREATERGISVSGKTSTMVHAILNELDETREARNWWKAEHDKQETIAENGKESLFGLTKMCTALERDQIAKLEADHREVTNRMQVEYEGKIVQINQEIPEKMKKEYEAKVELEKFVAREATERGISVSGETSTMVLVILNELDETREELIRYRLSRQTAEKSVGTAATETSDKWLSTTVTEGDFPSSIDDFQPVKVVIDVNEANLRIIDSNSNLAPLKVDLERLRARIRGSVQFGPAATARLPLPAITMETRSTEWRSQIEEDLERESEQILTLVFICLLIDLAYVLAYIYVA